MIKTKWYIPVIILLILLFQLHDISAREKSKDRGKYSDPFDKDAITTSINDAYPTAKWIEDFDRYYRNYNVINSFKELATGLSKIELKSYCLKPGLPVNNPNTYSYVIGPLKGTKSRLLNEIVKRASRHPEIEQKYIQTLIWGIIAGFSYSDYPEEFAKKISPLLPEEEKTKSSGIKIKDLLKLPIPQEIKNQLSIITDIRQLISEGINRYEDLERIAVPSGEPVSKKDDIRITENSWTLTDGGYYVRLKPGHYSRTKMEIYKPAEVTINYDGAGRVSNMKSSTGNIEIEYDDNPGAGVITYPSKNSYKINRISKIRLDGQDIGNLSGMLWYTVKDNKTNETSNYKRKVVGINVDPLEETFKYKDSKIMELFEYYKGYNSGKGFSETEERELYELKQLEYAMKFVFDTLRFQVKSDEQIEKIMRITTDASAERFTRNARGFKIGAGARLENLFDGGMTVAVPGNNAQRIGVTGEGPGNPGSNEDPPVTNEDPPTGRRDTNNIPNCRIELRQVDLNLLPAPGQLFMAIAEIECDEQIDEIEWTLFDISREQGRFMNDKDPFYYKTRPDKDLSIDAGENGSYEVTESEENFIARGRNEAPHYIVIKAHDYGAFGKLTLSVRIGDRRFFATCEGWGNGYINIPYDMDDNKIADKWEFENGAAGLTADWDEETIPDGQTVNGDGITNYEEYRGFKHIEATGETIHIRTKPMEKELFVVDKDMMLSTYLWENASGIRVYFLDNDLIKGSLSGGDFRTERDFRLVNFCRGYSAGTKYSVYLIGVEGLNDPFYGVCGEHNITNYWGCSRIGPPINVNYTVVMSGRIRSFYEKMRDTMNYIVSTSNYSNYSVWGDSLTINQYTVLLNNPERFEALVYFSINITAAHEVGHSCGTRHHSPDGFAGLNRCLMRFSYYTDRIFNFLFTFYDILTNIGEESTIGIFSAGNWHFCREEHNCRSQLNVNDRLP